jgi:lambda family phage tail tape measure protein
MTQTSRLVLEIDSRDAEQKAADTRKALEALEDAGLSIKPAMDKAGASLESVGKSATKAKKSIHEERDEIEQLLGSIDPLARKLNELEKQEVALNKARKSGKIELDTYTEYSNKIAATRAELARFNDSMGKTGISAKQTAAALRGVPAQFTDIATSLQGGQAPLTVFLQQGGQLKDMFGGAGPAAKALGGYVLGLINPFTVAAAAAGGLALAYKGGSNEATAFNQSLISTGNFAGATSSSLSAMAQSVGGTIGTTGAAAEALSRLASGGKIASTSFEMISTSALKFQEVTGRAVSETIADFEKIATDPAKALVELNDKFNFLTASVYEQVRALKENGDTAGAASVAEAAYAQALDERSTKIKDSLGSVETAWIGVKGEAKKAWDAIFDIGREDSLDQKLQKLEERLNKVRNASAAPLSVGDNPDMMVFAGGESAAQAEWQKTLQKEVEDQKAAREQMFGAAAMQQATKYYEDIKSQLTSTASKGDQLAAALKKSRREIDAARAQGYTVTAAEQAKLEAQLKDKFKESAKAAGPVDLTSFNNAENALKSLMESYQNSFKLLDASEKAGLISADEYALQKGALLEKEKSQVESAYQAEIAALEAVSAKASTTSAQRVGIDQKIADSRQKMVDTLKKLDTDQDILSQQTSARNAKDAASYKAFSESLNDSLKLAQQGLDNQLAGIGLGQEGRQRLQDDLKIRQDYQKQIEKLNRDYAAIVNPSAGQTDNYNKETQDLKDALAQRLASQQDYYVKLKQYQSDWTNGANAALQDYISETQDIAGQTYTLFSDSLHGIEDAFVDAATTGKLSFKDLADSIISDLARIVAKAYIVTPILAALGIGGDSATGSTGGGALSGLTGGGTGIMSYLNTAKNVMSAAGSSFGQSLMSGWASGDGIVGGLQGAFTNGADYIGSAITGAFSAGSATASNAAASLAAGASQAGYTGAAYQGYVSSANAAASLSSLTSALSYVGAVYSVIQSYQSYGVKGAATTAGFAAAGAAIGSVVPVIGTAIGAAVGAVVGSFASSKLFGSGEKYPDLSTSATGRYVNGQYTDTGIAQSWQRKAPKYGTAADNAMSSTITKFSTTLGNLYNALGNGAPVVAYNTLQQRKTSGKYSSTFGAQLDDGSVITGKQQFKAADISAALTADYDDIMGTFLAKAIVSSKSLPEYFKSQFTEFANDWNTTADQVIKAIEGVFTRFNGVNDALTLINVNNLKLDNTGLMASDSILNMIGAMADLDTTTATAKEKVDALNTAVGTYYQAFFSADEQFADLTDSLKSAFAGLGLELPDTRSAYRNIVESINVTTAAGQAMFATLVGLASNADAYYTEVDKRAQAAVGAWSNYYDLFASDSQKASDTLAAVGQQFAALGLALPATREGFATMVASIDRTTDSGKALFSSLLGLATNADAAFDIIEAQTTAANEAAAAAAQGVKDSLTGAVTNSFSAIQRAISAQQKAAQDAYNATNASLSDMAATAADKVSDLASVGNDLSSALKSLRGNSDDAVKMLRAQAVATLQSALATTRAGGSLGGFPGLSDALDTVGSNTTDLYSSLEDFNRDQGRAAAVVADLEATNGKQLTAAEKLQASLETQIDQAKAAYDLQSASFDSQLELAQKQLDAFNGVDTSILSVADAVNRMNAAVVAALSALPRTGAGSATANTRENNAALVNTAYNTAFGRDADKPGQSYWTDALQNGTLTYDELLAELVKSGRNNGESIKVPGYAAGGNFGGGIRLVGERGPEIELTGSSKILNARQTADALNGGGGASVVDALRALADQLDDIRANTQAGALSGNNVVKLLNRVTDGGNAMLTKELA